MAQTSQNLLNEVSPGATEPVESVHTSVQETQDGHHGAFPPFDSATFASQVLWLAITFGALYLLLSRFVLPRIGGILELRSEKIAADLGEAQRLKDETEAAIAAYESSLATARGKAQAIASDTRGKVQAESDAQRRVIEAQLNDRLAKAESEIAATKTAAMSNVRSIAVETAAVIVAQLLGKEPAAKDVESAVDASLKA